MIVLAAVRSAAEPLARRGAVDCAGAGQPGQDELRGFRYLTARPIGSTGFPMGFYEYLPPSYHSSGPPSPLLIALNGYGENGLWGASSRFGEFRRRME
jgi:hypothetical protein